MPDRHYQRYYAAPRVAYWPNCLSLHDHVMTLSEEDPCHQRPLERVELQQGAASGWLSQLSNFVKSWTERIRQMFTLSLKEPDVVYVPLRNDSEVLPFGMTAANRKRIAKKMKAMRKSLAKFVGSFNRKSVTTWIQYIIQMLELKQEKTPELTNKKNKKLAAKQKMPSKKIVLRNRTVSIKN